MLLATLLLALLVELEILSILVLKHSMSILTQVERDLRQALAGIFKVESTFVEDTLFFANIDCLLVVASREGEQVNELFFELLAELGQFDQELTQGNAVEWDVVSEASFIFALLAVLTLEAQDLFFKDLLVRETKQELAVEFELRRDE